MTAVIDMRRGRLGDHAATRVTLRCAHGSSSLFVIGNGSSLNQATLAVVRVRHSRANGCDCATDEISALAHAPG